MSEEQSSPEPTAHDLAPVRHNIFINLVTIEATKRDIVRRTDLAPAILLAALSINPYGLPGDAIGLIKEAKKFTNFHHNLGEKPEYETKETVPIITNYRHQGPYPWTVNFQLRAVAKDSNGS